MERLRTEQPKGMTRAGLRKWGLLFLMLGLLSRSVIQVHYLNMVGMSNDQLLEVMNSGPQMVWIVTAAIVMMFLETLAVPIFALLLADGVAHTSNLPMYIAKILGVAVVSELPYNYALSGKLLDLSTRNPVFGMALAAILVYLFKTYGTKKFSGLLAKVVFVVAAIFWCAALHVDHGIPIVILTLAFWASRNKPSIRNLVGGGGAMCCMIYSPFYALAAFSIMVVHFYNGEPGEENKWVKYLLYPVLLILFGVGGALAF